MRGFQVCCWDSEGKAGSQGGKRAGCASRELRRTEGQVEGLKGSREYLDDDGPSLRKRPHTLLSREDSGGSQKTKIVGVAIGAQVEPKATARS
jgi:hypothetical protein